MMSKNKKWIFAPLMVVLLHIGGSAMPEYDRLDLVIRIDESGESCVVEGKYSGENAGAQRNLSFVDSYADAVELAKRVLNPTVTGTDGAPLSLRKFSSGEYVASGPISGFRYQFDLSPPDPLIAAPHVSWYASARSSRVDGGRALLKLADILPQINAAVVGVKFDLPNGWSIATPENSVSLNKFETDEPENAVFLAGTHLRTQSRTFNETRVGVSVADQWQFDDDAVAAMALEILGEYRDLFGSMPRQRIQINLLSFPGVMGNDRWRAQTQGATITIVSSKSTYKNLAPQRLHEQLRHELFHLWIPEAVNLEGDYAWFYEGFAQYQSLKTGVWVGRLTFDDFLKSMSEAINIASIDQSKLPLPALSLSRWQTGPGVVSARGMSVAFLCDLLMIKDSKRKRNVGDLLRKIFDDHRSTPEAVSARNAIEKEFANYPELQPVLARQINKNELADWKAVLVAFGIKAESRGGRWSLSLNAKPTGRQKALLKKLGYNRWQSLPRS